jgi:hypothetical protein
VALHTGVDELDGQWGDNGQAACRTNYDGLDTASLNPHSYKAGAGPV